MGMRDSVAHKPPRRSLCPSTHKHTCLCWGRGSRGEAGQGGSLEAGTMAHQVLPLEVCALESISEAGWPVGEKLRTLTHPLHQGPLLPHCSPP